MKYLNKITISHARRFGRDIEIDFGTGATILHAPNGTGKTTVFEAIEFALTGKVKRLKEPPVALIRDKESGLEVRLDFEDNLYCAVSYSKGQDPVLSGDHEIIFNNIDSIPYLLRLTHLLEQRGTEWFVQARSEDAGDLLDRLPIGKDLNKIISTKTAAIRAANNAVKDVNDSYKLSLQNFEDFKKLLNNRNNITVDASLHPLDNLIVKITHLYSAYFDSKPNIENDLNVLKSLVVQSIARINSKNEDNSKLTIKLAKIEGRISEYISNLKTISENKSIIQLTHFEIESLKKDIESFKNQLNEINVKNFETNSKHNSLLQLRDFVIERESKKQQSDSLSQEFETLTYSLSVMNEELAKIIDNLEQANETNDKHKSLTSEEIELSKIKSELQSKEKLIQVWHSTLNRLDNFKNDLIPKLSSEYNEQTSLYKNKLFELNKLESEYHVSQDILNSLKGTQESISSAVKTIELNLSKTEGICPVCAAEYTPSELQTRISKAISYINPLIKDAVDKNKAAFDKLNYFKSQYAKDQELLATITSQLNDAVKQKDELQIFINENILPQFYGIQIYDDAIALLNSEMLKVDTDILSIADKKNKLAEITSFDDLELLTLTKQKTEREIDIFKGKLDNISIKLHSLNETLIRLNEKIGSVSVDDVRKDISDIENLVAKQELNIEKLIQSSSILQNSLDEKERQLSFLNNKISLTESVQNEIYSEWKDISLEDEPNFEFFNQKKDSLSKEKAVLANDITSLKQFDLELAKWSVAETYNSINKEIKELCGNLSEDEYLTLLETKMTQNKKNVSQIEEKRDTLNTLYKNIQSELEATHSHLEAINPTWNSLLNRVVVNPRFANIVLKSYSHRNKPQAKVQIKLHGDDTDVNQIASEAQITDIQLTFLLSMANTYNWTSWKALLLDDPTQHHDLVHTASVFDLLRDYIVFKDYQILLGTHDSVHADFFKRKLMNDGVPTKIWSLKSDDSGVKAELVE